MNLPNFIEGINILRPYYDDPDGYQLGAEHDQIYLYATQKPLPPEAVARLHALGWFQPDQDSEEGPAPYNPDDGWSVFP
jgi:hypothetical protein